MSYEVVLQKRDRFGRLTGGKRTVKSVRGADIARAFEQEATRGVKKEKRDERIQDLYHQEKEDD